MPLVLVGQSQLTGELIINDICYLFEVTQVLVVIRQSSFITCSLPHTGSLVPDVSFVRKKIEIVQPTINSRNVRGNCSLPEVLLGSPPQVTELPISN